MIAEEDPGVDLADQETAVATTLRPLTPRNRATSRRQQDPRTTQRPGPNSGLSANQVCRGPRRHERLRPALAMLAAPSPSLSPNGLGERGGSVVRACLRRQRRYARRQHQLPVDGEPEALPRHVCDLDRLPPGDHPPADPLPELLPDQLRHPDVPLSRGVGARGAAPLAVGEEPEDRADRQEVGLREEVRLERQPPLARERQPGDVLEAPRSEEHTSELQS